MGLPPESLTKVEASMLAKWFDVAGLLLTFAGPVVILFTSGKLGAVHSWDPPRWAHYTAWGMLTVGFLLQLFVSVCRLLSQ
jgi:hypothetical protein